MKQISFRQLNLAFSIALLTIAVSCSKDDGGNGGDNLKKTVLNMPWIDSEPLTGSTGNVDFWKFSAPYTEDGKFNVCAVQNGNVADLGKQAYKRTDNNGTAATIDIDLKGKINEDTAYDLYLISGNYSIFSGNIWSTVPLERSDKPTFFYSRKNVSGPFSADAQICGVIESVYIINKSGKSIKFVQKPFIADEKWYYTKADVNLFDGSIRNAKTETEPKANTYEVYAHAEGQSFRISSSYIPNGKKIQNARLQAEIDGKIYTTENTISSDLDLQMGHAYGMVVIWDGEKLRFDGSGVVEHTVIDLTNPEESEIDVISVDDEGTIVAEVPEDKVPEVGDYLCSGITEYAPYGMMLKVTDVQKVENSAKTRSSVRRQSKDDETEIKVWQFVFKTVKAAVDEVVGNIDMEHHVKMNDFSIDKVVDAEGNTLTDINHEDDGWNLSLPFKLGPITLTPKIGITPQDLVFYLTVKDYKLKRLGTNFIGKFNTSVQIDASLASKYKDSATLYYVILDPIWIPDTPIVITPLFIVYVGLEIDGKISASFVPVHNVYDFNVGGIYYSDQKKIIPVSGNNLCNINESSNYVSKRGVYNWETGFEFDASSIVSVGAGLSFGLDGCNYLSRIPEFKGKSKALADLVSADFRLDINTKISGKFGCDNINMKPQDGSVHLTDPCSLEIYDQEHAEFFLGKWDKEFKTDPEKHNIWKDKLFPTMFVSDFSEIKPEFSGDNIVFSTTKFKPYFGYGAFKEMGMGFRYMECDVYGNRKGDWNTINLKSVYGAGYDDLFKYDINTYIALSRFKKKTIYYICPYVYTLMPNGETAYIHRKGKFFNISDSGILTNNELPNIPGFDL